MYTGVQWVHECEWVACVCARTMYVSECVSVYASMHACVCTFVQQIFIGDTCAGLWGASWEPVNGRRWLLQGPQLGGPACH